VLGERMREEIHALSMQTLTPAQWHDPGGLGWRGWTSWRLQAVFATRRSAGFRRQNAALPILCAALLTSSRWC
jgi:hypothetical protein